ncbi:uncharacterized protein LOC128894033 isoform X1 [Hylaeus anthracinus]|uniref:uncharacterized protein LOC128894033 isoform X1 n=1 Tax=Hylaeus anthracinus TaxID=313031 RepID=UPI0023B8E1B1|nr:uncharacterized protein LOC128894033 isoform X1 [Hylaeus anthracinus]XP_054011406.1 uncharacterized protein LOC128894033 isoform X1 [Hylaeus anthracinus]
MTFIGAYTTCPFDNVHQILDGRLQKHIFKCRQNYPQITKVTCPFDATHILDPNVYKVNHHLSECRSTGNIKCFEHSLEPDTKVGTIPIEDACSIETEVLNEDWSGSAPAFNPVTTSENKCVMRSTVGSKKKRKQFKLKERERFHLLQNHTNNNKEDITNAKPKQLELETPLRVPKEAAKAVTCDLKSMITQMRDISIDKSVKNVSPKKGLEETISNNTTKEENDSVSSKNSQCKNKDTTLRKEMDSSATEQSTSKENIDTSIHDTQSNNSKKHDKIEVQRDLSQRNVVKERSYQINPKIAATFYGQAKKISTGRGFTIACENLIPKTNKDKNESRNETLEVIRIARGYHDDENDEEDT